MFLQLAFRRRNRIAQDIFLGGLSHRCYRNGRLRWGQKRKTPKCKRPRKLKILWYPQFAMRNEIIDNVKFVKVPHSAIHKKLRVTGCRWAMLQVWFLLSFCIPQCGLRKAEKSILRVFLFSFLQPTMRIVEPKNKKLYFEKDFCNPHSTNVSRIVDCKTFNFFP